MVLAVFFRFDKSGVGIISFLLCIAHELGHLLVIRLLKISPEYVEFYGAGIKITSSQTELLPPLKQALVYSAGCAVNFLLAVFLYFQSEYAALLSLVTGLFNLLPVGAFDGKRLLYLALTCGNPLKNPEKAMKIAAVLSCVASVACAAYLLTAALLGKSIGFTAVTTLLYFVLISVKNV